VQPVASERNDPLRKIAIGITVLLHLGVLGAMFVSRALGNRTKPPGQLQFVDASLVRFGKPRDLSFLPHKQGVVKNKGPAPEIKVARDMNQLPRLDKEQKPDEVDPLKKTHAEQFKHLDDQPEGVDNNEGQLTGSRAGNATEAKGDPYILSLVDQIGTAWTVPTTLRDSDLAELSADVCLTIADSGALTHYEIVHPSKNSQFNSSLEATLSMIKHLPPPPERWHSAASRGRLCPTFSKQ
jgi:TonB C terminal